MDFYRLARHKRAAHRARYAWRRPQLSCLSRVSFRYRANQKSDGRQMLWHPIWRRLYLKYFAACLGLIFTVRHSYGLGSKDYANHSPRGYLAVLRVTASLVANMPPSDIVTFAIQNYQGTRKRIHSRLVKSIHLYG